MASVKVNFLAYRIETEVDIASLSFWPYQACFHARDPWLLRLLWGHLEVIQRSSWGYPEIGNKNIFTSHYMIMSVTPLHGSSADAI